MTSLEVITVMGKSGAGKHRIVEAVRAIRGLRRVATGDYFRSAAASEASRNAARHGKWAPDAAADAYVAGELSQCRGQGSRGCVIDGYPRTVPQAEKLLELTRFRCDGGDRVGVVLVDTPDDVVVKRMQSRRVCSNGACAAVYNMEVMPPTPDGRCHRCGARVEQRQDDADEQRIRERLRQFTEKTLPAIHLLEARGVPVRTVPGTLPFNDNAALNQTLKHAIDW